MRAIPLVVLSLLLVNFVLAGTAHAKPEDTDGTAAMNETGAEMRFAVTLRSSFTPISDKQAKREITDRPVYLIQTKAFGKNVYNLRVGFFDSFSEANVYRNSILAKYPAALVTEIGRNEYAVIQRTQPAVRPAVTVEPKKAEPPPTSPTAPALAPALQPPSVAAAISPKALYVVQLEKSSQPIRAVRAPLPTSLKNNRLYVTQSLENGKTYYQLKLGFFEKEQDVFAARQQMKATYPNAKVMHITPNEQNDSIRLALGAPAPSMTAPPVAAAPAPVPPTPAPKPAVPTAAPALLPKVTVSVPATPHDKEALTLMEKSRAALAKGDNKTAIALLDKLLRLPPNRYSQDAQEYIGLARQRIGDTTSAKSEYQLYLRLYPTGEGADRVRQRLAALEPAKTTDQAPVLRAVKLKVEAQSSMIGNLSQFYFHGASKIDTTTITPGTNELTQAGLSQTDQSALVTNLNLTHRYRSEDFDNRFVLRDTHTKNFLADQDDSNRLSALYYEIKDRIRDYSARFGRQPGGTAGALGRFDGLLASYNFNSKWRINATGGVPTDITYDSDLKFQGIGMDLGPFADHWGGSLYTIQQKVDGVTDRNAVGSELRYFSPSLSVYGLFDYDTEFKDSNIALIQGNWTATNGTTVHMLFDSRKTPSLGLINALIGETDTSIESQLLTKSYEQLKEQARNLTATIDTRNIGISQPLDSHWQLGFDISTSHTSSTVGSANSPGLPDSGTTRTYTGNAIGIGLFSARDVSVLTYSRTEATTSTGNLYALTNRLLWGASWELETSLSWYSSHDSASDTDSKRFSPTLRPRYKWKQNITLEAEFGQERTDTTSPTSTDKNTRRYWSLGYRWDF